MPPSRVVALPPDWPAGGGGFKQLAGMLLLAVPPLAANAIALPVLARGPGNPVAGSGAFTALLRRVVLPDAARALFFSIAPITAALIFQGDPSPLDGLALGIVVAAAIRSLVAFGSARDLVLVESGEFRSRVMQLAAQAGTRLNVICLFRNHPPHEANAFTYVGGCQVLFTESLLLEFPRREVDALIAHEIGHLQARPAIHVPKVYEAYATAYHFIDCQADRRRGTRIPGTAAAAGDDSRTIHRDVHQPKGPAG